MQDLGGRESGEEFDAFWDNRNISLVQKMG